MWVNGSGHSPKMSDHEWLAHIAERKWAIMSESLRSLTKKERLSVSMFFFFFLFFWVRPFCAPWAYWYIISGAGIVSATPHPAVWANHSFAHFWAKNEQFAWKTDAQIPSPDINTRKGKFSVVLWSSRKIQSYTYIELGFSILIKNKNRNQLSGKGFSVLSGYLARAK